MFANWTGYVYLWLCVGMSATAFLLVLANPTARSDVKLMTGSQVLAFCVIATIFWPFALLAWWTGQLWGHRN